MTEAPNTVWKGASTVAEVQSWRKQLMTGVMHGLLLAGGLAVAAEVFLNLREAEYGRLVVTLAAYGVLLVVALWRRVSFEIQTVVLVVLLYAMGAVTLYMTGPTGDGIALLLTVPLLIVLFLGWRPGILSLAIVALTLAGFGWAFVAGRLVVPAQELARVTDLSSWLSRGTVFLFLSLLLILPANYLLQRLSTALGHSHKLARELEVERAELERQVQERTADLERRTEFLQATAEIAREVTSVMDSRELLSRVVFLVSERFGFYHTGIFLLDESGEWAVLQAASSNGGRRMLARGHRLKVGEVGLVGFAIAQGEARIALDVGADAVYFDNPDLPQTRSEMALPLRARGRVLGALDVQSVESAAFGEEDVALLQTLADQVALAISNSRLFEQVETSLETERRAFGELVKRGWSDLLRGRSELAGRFDPQELIRAEQWRPAMKQASEEGHVVVDPDRPETLAVPIRVRGEAIGVLDAHRPVGGGEWTAPEIAVLETMAEQLGMALESARLYQDTRRRALREQTLSEMTSRFTRALDIDTLLRSAVREFGQLSQVTEASIHINPPEDVPVVDADEDGGMA